MGLAGPSGSETLADWVRSVNDPSIYGGVAASQNQVDVQSVFSAGGSTATTTSSTTLVALPDTSIAMTVNGKQTLYLLGFVVHKNSTTARRYNRFTVFRDSTQLGGGVADVVRDYPGFAGDECTAAFMFRDTRPTAGSYTYQIYWATENAGDTASVAERMLYALVVPDRPVT